MPDATTINQSVNTPTVLSSWTRVLVTALRERGVDPDPLLLEAGLEPAKVTSPEGRFPLTATTRLWQLAAEATGEEALGLRVSKHSTHTTFHALGYAFMASRSLRDAMERVVRFNGMVSDAANVAFDEHDGTGTLSWTLLPGMLRPADEAMEAVIAAIIRACRRRTGHEFAPTRTALMRDRPQDEGSFHQFFRCEVIYGAPGYELQFRSSDLDAILPDANEELARSIDRLGDDYLARLELGSVATRLRTLLARELPSGARPHDHYAGILGLSGRSLQRKLSAEGTSFNQVLNETRCELAKSYLGSEHRQSLTEIAFLLGFSDTSSFSRAFHRWTGTAPSDFTV